MKYFLVTAFLITVLVVSFTIYVDYQATHGKGSNLEPQYYTLSSGQSIMDIGADLEAKGIIDNRFSFGWAVATRRLSHNLIAGEYKLSGQESIQEILTTFTTGKVVTDDIKVTFPEGWTMKLMADRLTKNGLPGEAFLKEATNPSANWREEYAFLADAPKDASLEGYLFPDTYFFAPDVTGEQIVAIMLGNFDKRYTKKMREDTATQKKTIYDIVTLASIVEEEGRLESDRKIIADIFWKRLAIGQPFQSDATVNYVLGTLKEQPTLKDIEFDSPYNTYKYAGLPPGPISNPSIISLNAALYPTPNPYYFFLNNLETKEMYFAETFEGHIENRRIHGL